MSVYVLVGKDIKLDAMQRLSIKNGAYPKFYGDGIDTIDCDKIEIEEDANVIIHAHGVKRFEGYSITLCNNEPYTQDVFRKLSKNKALNIELFSCYGSSAKAHTLATFSTLISMVSSNQTSRDTDDIDVYQSSLDFSYFSNPFFKFASYLFVNPQENRFSIKLSKKQSKFFLSNTDQLINSIENKDDILTWQKQQLSNFIDFCKRILPIQNLQKSTQIKELLELYDDSEAFNDWLIQFDSIQYQRLLIRNMIKKNDYEAVVKLVRLGIDVNTPNKNGITALMLAISEKKIDIVNALLTRTDLDINYKNEDGKFSLFFAAFLSSLNIVQALITRQDLDVNIRDNIGITALNYAAYNGKDNIVEALLQHPSIDVDATTNKGITALLATILHQTSNTNKIVKLLLSSGAEIDDSTYSYPLSNRIILEEIKLFQHNPTTYILKNNDNVNLALRALTRLESQKYSDNLLSEVERIKICLTGLSESFIEDLVNLCGQDSSDYVDLEL